MKQSKKASSQPSSIPPDDLALLWIGQADIFTDSIAHSRLQTKCLQIELDVGDRSELSIRDFSKNTAQKVSPIKGVTKETASLHILKTLRTVGHAFAIIQYDPETLAYWQHFIEITGIEFCFWFDKKHNLNWSNWPLIMAASARFIDAGIQPAWWATETIFEGREIASAEELIQATNLQLDQLHTPHAFTQKASDQQPLKVSLISYFAPPIRTVAMQRIRYWADNISPLSEEVGIPIETRLITAANDYRHAAHVDVVRDFGTYRSHADTYFNQHTAFSALRLNTLALSWAQTLHNEISRNPDRFHADCVIISGNPFTYFSLGKLYKELFNSKIILDFRDPLSANPRMQYTPEQRQKLKQTEDMYIASADAVISVNEQCLHLLSKQEDTAYLTVANGFDEALIRTNPNKDRTKNQTTSFIYTGTFYGDCPPDIFASMLESGAHRFNHYGKKQSEHETLIPLENFSWHGQQSYADIMDHARMADAGLIFTGGKPFEQTTKIFDYIAADIDIIIVTAGDVKTGGLHDLTKDLDRIYWVQNTKQDIANFLSTYKPQYGERPQRDAFSRKAQTLKLIELVGHLCRPGEASTASFTGGADER